MYIMLILVIIVIIDPTHSSSQVSVTGLAVVAGIGLFFKSCFQWLTQLLSWDETRELVFVKYKLSANHNQKGACLSLVWQRYHG